jgi:hypothetical protein
MIVLFLPSKRRYEGDVMRSSFLKQTKIAALLLLTLSSPVVAFYPYYQAQNGRGYPIPRRAAGRRKKRNKRDSKKRK